MFLGWSLGANDAANVFGTAVSSRMVRYRTAVLLTALFVILGAYLEGVQGIKTLSNLTSQNLLSAFIVAVSAAIAVTMMTAFKLPVSTSQAVVGAIIGIGISNSQFNFQGLTKVVLCWVGTPFGAILIAILLYFLLSNILNRLNLSLVSLDFILRTGLVLGGAYGAYALGANNVANVTGVFANTIGLSPHLLAIIGAVSISIGVITYSKNVMYTIGKKLVPLDAFSALVAILAEAVTVHIYAKIGVPVSTSQAIIGAVIGIGIIKGMRTINIKTLFSIMIGWVSTPLISGIISFALISFILGK
ncbi:MAG: inorganic phosphate transporter family protein [Spirochaetes bacterium]|nr:inorganic phosphate transporter family protein [Spirochaetota bacterium]